MHLVAAASIHPKHLECARLCKQVYDQKSDILIRHNKHHNDVIIAVEGTDTLVNWYDNLSVCKRSDDVHTGFRKYATYCKQKYKLHAELKKYKGHRMYICGHSLGGAILPMDVGEISIITPSEGSN